MTFSENVNDLKFTCHVDGNNNPFQDCLNAMAYFCHPDTIADHPSNPNRCKKAVDDMVGFMNPVWQNVRIECGQWPWNGYKGNVTSDECTAANAALHIGAQYVAADGFITRPTLQLTDSVNARLWSNTALEE